MKFSCNGSWFFIHFFFLKQCIGLSTVTYKTFICIPSNKNVFFGVSRAFGKKSRRRKSKLRRRGFPAADDNVEKLYGDFRADTKLIVAAIDIGTAYSGYAFAFMHDHVYDVSDPDRIHVNAWEFDGGSRTFYKTPTCLLLKPDGSLHSFGSEAMAKYNALTDEHQHRDWYFFTQFKLTLHQEEVLYLHN